MPNFVARVQLPGKPSEETYQVVHDTLHTEGLLLQMRGFTPSEERMHGSMPHATYFGDLDSTAATLRDRIVAVLLQHGTSVNAVFVAEVAD